MCFLNEIASVNWFFVTPTRSEVAHCAADNLRIFSGPVRVSDSAPRSSEEDFHTSLPLVGPADQTQITISELSSYSVRIRYNI